MSKDANTLKIVGLLAEVAKLDTVFRDVHLRRARQLLSSALDESAYRVIGSTEKEIDDLMRQSRTAVMHRDWTQAAELSARVESLRQRQAKMSSLAIIGKEIYEADTVAFDPFSPGKHLGLQGQTAQPNLRTQVVDALASLAKLDIGSKALYEMRRDYFSRLEVKGAAVAQKDLKQDRARAEQAALEAAERGDVAALQRLAKELRDWKEPGAAATTAITPVMLSRYECPIDLAASFPAPVIERAKEFGLAEIRTAPVAELATVREVIYSHADQPIPSNPDMEREGVTRARAQAELQLPAELDTEEPRVLASQFIQQIFVNSGGARYLPPLSAETVLFEDFAEDEPIANAPSKLLAALGLAKRSGLSRENIEAALLRSGGEILENSLGLDPVEFRVVCIPYDLYGRLGPERGFGKWRHWTHFDGYQVMSGNRLRALAGGDGRFGGVYDLVSISPSDSRDGVYARFAVVRRARQTSRWR